MASVFQLEIVTPDRKFYNDSVEMVIFRSTEGDIGIMGDHMPTVIPLSIGVIRIKKDGKIIKASCAGGFANIDEYKTTIITDAAEWPEEIDVKRAEAAAARARKRLEERSPEIDIARAEIALKKALNRIRLAKSEK